MKRILFVIVLAALLIATTGAASAGTTRIYFKGSTVCSDEDLSELREWLAGPNYQARGYQQACVDTATLLDGTPFAPLTGTEHIVFNIVGANFILAGTDSMDTAAGEGVWVGNWQWPAQTWIIHIVMHGRGAYAGQQLHMWEDASTDEFWGYIEVTGN